MAIVLDPTFTSEDHRYTDAAGNVVPSVTELIGQYWPVDRTFYTHAGADRGTQIHNDTAAIDRGLLTLSMFEGSEHYNYLRAWDEYVSDNIAELIWIEQKFLDPIFGYAGTVDRVAQLRSGEFVVLDLKSGKPEKWHELQQGAYAFAAKQEGIPVEACYTIQIKPTGKYKAIKHDAARAIFAWQSLMNWHNYRRSMKG